MNHSNCWYQDVCSIKKENCTESCVRYLEMRYLIENSNIPSNRQTVEVLNIFEDNKCDAEAYHQLSDIKNDIVEFINNGKNLYICSANTGNGKTSWAIKIMLKYFNEIWAGNGFKVRALFIHVPTFLLKVKDFGNKDESFEQLKRLIPEVDLVVWDDIASTNISSYDYSQLLMYLDIRCLNNKTNIYTGNITGADDIEKALGSKLTSRIWSNSTIKVEFKGGDRR